MLAIFNTKPLLPEQSADWIYQCFAWALANFDRQEFNERTRLIEPTNAFFPGRVDSVHAKAVNIFSHCQRYAGLSHWPFVLLPPEQFSQQSPALLGLTTIERDSSGSEGSPVSLLSTDTVLALSYQPQQTLKPEDLSSSFAHLLAQHMVAQSQQLPPGGRDYFIEATEVVAIFLGFGVMMVNSAYSFKGGCGSCYNASANRQASLSENEVVFALAVFCQLKSIPYGQATRYLKAHLRASYKRAVKQIKSDIKANNYLTLA
ncbi:hypothetical protein SIN8267_01313 [Sinobacterium norvegicum]|uniref:Orphan protein n=1 Tax=Sinobacterium norvegicum TaxID=1641715 RepID=A0ABN8EM74_9GAMM|nr:hypothetical protein [Sinobacterium norvegicum]CAH0991211.1 hypothetical protein SIN8267_01313 [Sinobacterium norvegicum]